MRVLVVDDNASAREILAAMTRGLGVEVDVVASGTEALDLLGAAEGKAPPYDLVLMDWKMPGMDGVETVCRMQRAGAPRVPAVIMVTAFGREEAMDAADRKGAAIGTVLAKPVTPLTLLEAIGEALGKGVATETRSRDAAGQASDAMQRLAGARVLLVEDNDMNQELATELLGQAGMQVVVAGNGQVALDILSREASPSSFDGILMDCQMPVMDGYTATREIRRNPAYRDVPIIAMTANVMAGDREKVLEAGMNDHVAKPLEVDKMFATLARWIVPKRAGDTTGSAGDAPPPPAVDGLPALPGVDVAAGLVVTMGNQKLYKRLLIMFRDNQATFAQQFAAALTDADPEAATRAAHTLKGTAGNIGAKALQAAAAKLEAACKAGLAAEIDSCVAATLAELSPVLAGLAAVRSDASAPAAASGRAVDTAKAGALLDRLDALLATNNTKAVDVAEELAGVVAGSPLAPIVAKVSAAISDYDYDTALHHAREARSALTGPSA